MRFIGSLVGLVLLSGVNVLFANQDTSQINEDAFRGLLNSTLPLSPDQIKVLRKNYELTKDAIYTDPKSPPLPVSSSLLVNLNPGASSPVIRVAAGFITSLIFADSTGAPWPIVDYSVGDPGAFNIAWDQNSNTLFVQGSKKISHGNLALRLQNLNTPVMLTLASNQSEVDYRTELRIDQHGPYAIPTIETETVTDPILMNLLDGIAPDGAIKLEVSRNYGQAWLTPDQKLYFRTKLEILTPKWHALTRSADGTIVYALEKSPYILAYQDGSTISIPIRGL